MTRIRPLLVCVLAVAFLGVSAAAAQAACNKTWTGGSGDWSEPGHWSPTGVPEPSESACITAAGTYTVKLHAGGGNVASLTVGGSSGVQTVEVEGTSYVYGGETQRVTQLAMGSGSFAANTRLILNATGGGTATGSEELGASAFLAGGPIEEHGQVETVVTDPKFDDRIKVNGLKIEPGASVQVASGTLKFIEEGEGAYPWSVTNEGTFTVASGAAVTMQPSFAGDAAFTNDGAVVNDGSISGSGTEWVQSGGSESGNEVVLQNGSTLVDSAGTGTFLGNYGTLVLTGTIPAGQTVIVRGEPFNYGGETYFTTGLSNGATELVNDGTLVLNPTGSGETGGGNVNVEPGSIHNNGTIDVETETASRVTQLQESLTNGPSGHLEINGGIFQGNSGARIANEGLTTVAPGAVLQLQEASAFVNTGTFSPEIASAGSFGAVQLFSPCCSGPGVFSTGGTLAPVLVGGFTPATGQEFDVFALDGGKFEGTFPSVANGFTGDYSHESSETAFVGVIYGGSSGGGGGGGGGNTGPPPVSPFPHLTSASSKDGKVTAKLSCPAGGATCAPGVLKVTVLEHLNKHGRIVAVTAKKARTKTVTIASATVTVSAGGVVSVTLKLNASGRALLTGYKKLSAFLTLSSGGKRLQRLEVRLVEPKNKRK